MAASLLDIADSVDGLAGRVREILAGWDARDDEDRARVVEDLEWLLDLVQSKLETEPRGSAVRFRCLQAFADLSAHKAEILEKMGVRLEDYAW